MSYLVVNQDGGHCLQVTCALTQIMRVPEAVPAVMTLFPRLLAALLLNMASMVSCKAPRVSKVFFWQMAL